MRTNIKTCRIKLVRLLHEYERATLHVFCLFAADYIAFPGLCITIGVAGSSMYCIWPDQPVCWCDVRFY